MSYRGLHDPAAEIEAVLRKRGTAGAWDRG